MDNELKVRGLVLREVHIGEADKILTLICEGVGRIDVSAKGVRSLRSPHMAATQIFAYSSFVLRKGKKYYYISESEMLEPFYGLRSDIDRLSLATYLADITLDLIPEGTADDEMLRLTLNTFYAISAKKNIPLKQIKAAFEFKAADLAGFCPDLGSCLRCGTGNHKEMYLDVMNGGIVCGECKTPVVLENARTDSGIAMIHLKISDTVLTALRFVVNSDEKRFLSFSIPDTELKRFADVCERYLLDHLEHGFHSLEFYKSMILEE